MRDRPIVFSEHVARVFRISKHTARRWMARGRFGRAFRAGKRLAVLKADFDRGVIAMRDGRPLGRRPGTSGRRRDMAGRFTHRGVA